MSRIAFDLRARLVVSTLALLLAAGCYGEEAGSLGAGGLGGGPGGPGDNGTDPNDPFGDDDDDSNNNPGDDDDDGGNDLYGPEDEEYWDDDEYWNNIDDPTLADNVEVLADNPCFQDIDLEYSETQLTVFFTCDAATVGLEVGDIIVGAQHGGYLREIVDMDVYADHIVADTVQARLEDIIEDGGFSEEISFGNERATLDFSGTNIYSGTHQGADITVQLSEGTMSLVPTLQLNASFRDYLARRTQATLNLDFDMDVELMAQISKEVSFSGDKELGSYSWPFAFAAGPVPVTGTLDITLSAGFETNADAQVTATVGAEAEADITIGAKYRSGHWKFVQRKTWDAERTGPDIEAQGHWDGKVWVQVEAKVSMYRVAGPTFSIAPFVRGEADAECSDLDWSFFAGADANAGLDLDLWVTELHKDFGPWTFESNLGEGTINLPFPLGTNCPGTCTAGEAISCGQVISGNTATGEGAVSAMDGYPGDIIGNYDANELVYSFNASGGQEIEFRFIDPTPTEVNHDIIILDGTSGTCSSAHAVERGFNNLVWTPETGGQYFVVVDGYDGDQGAFQLELDCNPNG